MACLGVHFALTESEVSHLRSFTRDSDRLEHLQETIEETYMEQFSEFTAQTDKAWDAMHRTLSDGELTWEAGEYPLNHVVLAGELLYAESDYIMSLKSPQQVREIAAALPGITEAEFRKRYFAINAKSYGFPLSEEDFAYTWESFQSVRALYESAAKAARCVLFTADQ